MLSKKTKSTPAYAIVKKYNGSFSDAVDDITTALKREGFGILTNINVTETLKNKLGVDYQDYVILGACNPPNAYKALQAEKEIGLLLPCNVAVYKEAEFVYIAIMKPTVILTLTENKIIAEVAEQVEQKLRVALERAVA